MNRLPLVLVLVLIGIGCLVLVPSTAVATDGPKPIADSDLVAASQKAVAAIQRSQSGWKDIATCTSCHHQILPEAMLGRARARGIQVDEAVASGVTERAFSLYRNLDLSVQGYDYIDVLFDSIQLVGAHDAGMAPNLSSDIRVQAIASHQLSDGSWLSTDLRPPQSAGRFGATALAARAVALYMPARLSSERDTRVAHARAWLLGAKARTTEERASQLFGLLWTGASAPDRARISRDLVADQRADGGWAELTGRDSDAYSTGQALAALTECAGLSVSSAPYQRGLRFLLSSQQPDGTWQVHTRLHPPAPVSPAYVETGFPYAHDQFVSIMGTTWATMAMVDALPAKAGALRDRGLASFAPETTGDASGWMSVAIDGTASDLKKLLDTGLDANSATPNGTTLLMMAARDPEKVKLLVGRGANVNAKASDGITPLMVAARFNGNSETVRFLLESGARPSVEKGQEVIYDASPMFLAVMSGDVQSVGALADAGARIDVPMKVLGQFPYMASMFASSAGDTKMVELLLARGATVKDVDGDEMSLLQWAAIGNRIDLVRWLIAKGADVNHVDKRGMTALMYAASIDYGDSEVVQSLLDAGSNTALKTTDGKTAADLARGYGHDRLTSILTSRAVASRSGAD